MRIGSAVISRATFETRRMHPGARIRPAGLGQRVDHWTGRAAGVLVA